MKTSTKEFLPIASKDFEKLLRILKGRNPRSCMLYNVAKLHSDQKFSAHVNLKFYFEGDSLEDAYILSVMTFSYFAENVVLLSSPGEDISDEFTEMIENTLDWSNPHSFGDLNSSQIPVINEMCRKHCNPVDTHEYLYYYMDIDSGKGLQNQIPATVQIKQLHVSNAEFVEEKWAAAAPGLALRMVQDSIETIASIGVFEKASKAEKLLSWLIISPVGSFNALHTEDEYRGKGYGQIALKSMIHFATEKLNIFPVCHVELKNDASSRLMEKVGFQLGENIYWLNYKFRPSYQVKPVESSANTE